MANTFNLGNGNWAQKTEKLLAYNAENDNYKPLPFDFDRASTATRVNKQGLIETVGTDEPRIDFLNNTKGHLLLEPSRTNLLPYSEDFSEWSIARATLEADAITSPDGGLTYKLKESTDTNSHPLYFQGITVSASASHTMSVFVKAAGRSIIRITLTNGGSATSTYFDLSTEDVTSGTGNIENFGNGWYRCSTTFTTTVTNQEVYIEPVISGTTQSYTGDGVSGFYVYGAQLEAGSYPTSYIPTQGSAVTRSAETCNNAGNDSIFNEAQGVLYVESEALANDETSRVIASISNGSSDLNRVVLQYTNNVGGNQVIAFAQTASGYSSVHTRSITNALTFNKFAVVYNDSTNNFDLWVNGTKLGDGSFNHSFTANVLSKIQFADGSTTNNPFYGKIKDIKVYNTALSDSELQALTS